MKEIYDKDGGASVEFLKMTIYYEDDDYYYYVKAVPKMTVAAPTNTVKKINTQRRPARLQNSSVISRLPLQQRTKP